MARHDKYRNWSIEDHFPEMGWKRDSQGRGPVWSAYVQFDPDDRGWWGNVLRSNNGFNARPNGRWELCGFSSADEAIEYTEDWIKRRRDPMTWRGDRPIDIPVGDFYRLWINDPQKEGDR